MQILMLKGGKSYSYSWSSSAIKDFYTMDINVITLFQLTPQEWAKYLKGKMFLLLKYKI